MKNDEELLGFVKAKIEENEGIAPDSLARLLAAAGEARSSRNRLMFLPRRALLVAASLVVAACGWYFANDSINARREGRVASVIALLSAADGGDVDSGSSLSDALCAWQDAPTLAAAD